MSMAREQGLVRAIVQLADSLVDDFDIIDLLTVLADCCVDLLDADAAGILLADPDGNLRVMAASSERVRLLELFQLQNDEGPCLESHRTGAALHHSDLRSAGDRWPRFAGEAVSAGFESVDALPLRLRTTVIGALNLFRAAPGPLPEADVLLAQALGDIAAIAILQDQAVRESQLRAVQLQHALDSRVAIEQAKGVLAERAQVDMEEAFGQIRSFARSRHRRLTDVATEIIAGALALEDLAEPGSEAEPTS
jgi:GAF domain-containing protein